MRLIMLNLGVDIVAIDRIQSILSSDKGLRFMKKIFSDQEIAESENKGDKSQYFSGRFAAKEAFSKAIGTGISRGINFDEIIKYLELIGSRKTIGRIVALR